MILLVLAGTTLLIISGVLLHKERLLSNQVALLQSLLTTSTESQTNTVAARPLQSDKQKRSFRLPIIAAALLGVAVLSLILLPSSDLAIALLVSSAAVYLLHTSRTKRPQESRRQAILLHLPLFLERLTMAVRAGHDLVPAIEIVVSLEEAAAQREARTMEPVSTSFRRVLFLVDQGLAFEEALDVSRRQADLAAVRHAFLYLAIAYREGGDLVGPLLELADSTQLAYEEYLEERVAALPAKALLPLLCTFTGLFLCLVTPPIVQVLKVTATSFKVEAVDVSNR